MARFEKEATLIYDWNGRSPLSYQQFLQNRKYEQSIRFAIDDQTRALLGSNQQLARLGVALAERTEAGLADLGDGLYEIRNSVDAASEEMGRVREAVEGVGGAVRSVESAIREGNRELATALYWGFSNLLASQGRMNDSLAELVSIARTPAQTWAYEQFEIAKENNRRGLYAEALEAVERAIGGFAGQTGYRTEFRFSMFLGLLRLGSYENASPEIVNAAAAEGAFLDAARYARSDHSLEAAEALICAGRAAFIQLAYDRALEHTRAGLALRPTNAQGQYQLARILAEMGESQDAIKPLASAIVLSPQLSISAAAIGEFPDITSVRSAMLQALQQLKEFYLERRQSFERGLGALSELQGIADVPSSAMDLIADEISLIAAGLSAAESTAAEGTISSVESATRMLASEGAKLSDAFRLFQVRFDDVASQEIERLTGERRDNTAKISANQAKFDRVKASSADEIARADSKYRKDTDNSVINTIGCVGTFVVLLIVAQIVWPLIGFMLPKVWQIIGTLSVCIGLLVAAPVLWGRLRDSMAGAPRRAAVANAEEALARASRDLTQINAPLEASLRPIDARIERISARRQEIRGQTLPEAIASLLATGGSWGIRAVRQVGASGRRTARLLLRIVSGGDRKLNVIKELRSICPDLDLAAGKALVENTPSTLEFEGEEQEIEAITKTFEAAGATVKISLVQPG